MKRVTLNLKIAARSLCNFRLRTSLAVFGVLLGTFSLIVVYSVSDSLALRTRQETESLGKNILVVTSGLVRRFGPSARLISSATTLTLDDALALKEGSVLVGDTVPAGNKPFHITYRQTTLISINVVGVSANFPGVRNFGVGDGRFFTPEEDRDLDRVAVIGTAVAEKLFGAESPIGKNIFIYRVPVRVIGVMEPKGVDISGLDQDNQIFLPVRTYMRRFVNKDYINSIYVQAVSEEDLQQAKKQIEGILGRRHGTVDFTVIDMRDVAEVKRQALDIIGVLGRVAAVVAFLIGGIGILSIMILIVNERKLEIGIRRAVGSRRRDIALQFLIESSFISFTGGMAGAVLGFVGSVLVFKFGGLPFTFSFFSLLLSFLASVLVGIAAGIYPAKRAVGFEPVEIIRG